MVVANILQHLQKVEKDAMHMNLSFMAATGSSIMDFEEVSCVVAVLLKRQRENTSINDASQSSTTTENWTVCLLAAI